jgi:hypothetical protein
MMERTNEKTGAIARRSTALRTRCGFCSGSRSAMKMAMGMNAAQTKLEVSWNISTSNHVSP